MLNWVEHEIFFITSGWGNLNENLLQHILLNENVICNVFVTLLANNLRCVNAKFLTQFLCREFWHKETLLVWTKHYVINFIWLMKLICVNKVCVTKKAKKKKKIDIVGRLCEQFTYPGNFSTFPSSCEYCNKYFRKSLSVRFSMAINLIHVKQVFGNFLCQ